ncbi:hypothetical protein CPB83DRAFT_888714 [Crepidotus variabilis]|uniref:Uncharacterized protein n=1 Tax=Crepidotus variabilis TaxID=179855 RepID=A0A9P6ERG7_9AGAR|nr:hypothetical protein CPB83DRAFT_888714 [Crepidotus variabilis]
MALVRRQAAGSQEPAANPAPTPSASSPSAPVSNATSTSVTSSATTTSSTSRTLPTTSSSSSSSSVMTSTTSSSTSASTTTLPPTTSSSVLTSPSISATSSSLPSPTSRPTLTSTKAATTIMAPDNIVPLGTTTNDVLTSAPPVSNAITGATKSGFMQNKGAVAATFTFSSLIFIAALVAIIVAVMKRRNARKETALHDELFISYVEPADYHSNYRSDSPEPSLNDTPMDPFSRREVVYDAAPEMSQGHSSSNHSHYSHTIPVVQVTPPVQHPDYYNARKYLPPSQTQTAASAVAVKPTTTARLKHVSAQSGYQQSVDSFYGAEQPSGYS